jgi:hypothetical protein
MAQPIVVGDIVQSQVIVYATDLQQIAVLNRYWRCSAVVAVGLVTDQDAADVLDALWAGRYVALIYNQAAYRGTRCRIYYRPPAVTNFSWQSSITHAGTGTAGAIALPTQTAGLISMKSAIFGRHGEGRQYLPFPAAADNILEGVPRAGYIAAATSLGTMLTSQQLITAGGGGQLAFDPIVFPRATPASWTVLNSFNVPGAWATQKRRGAFGRFNRPPF